MHRLYRGKLDRPKSERSKRNVALPLSTRQLMAQWQQQQNADPQAWVFPSAKRTTPLDRDAAWRWGIRPRLQTVGIDPKLIADQLGHGLGVHLDVYTVTALEKGSMPSRS